MIAIKPLKKSIKLPSVAHAHRMLGEWLAQLEQAKAGRSFFWNANDCEIKITFFKEQLAFAEFCSVYTLQHDCNPVARDKRGDGWGNRTAIVTIEGSEYYASVNPGRRVRIAFKPRGQNWGNHWYMSVTERGDGKRRLINGERCEKSQSLGTAALLAHLREQFRKHVIARNNQ